MNPDSDPADKSPREGSEHAPETGASSRLQRLKQFFRARYLQGIDSLSGFLKRLRKQAGSSREEAGDGEERSEARSSRKKPTAPPAAEQAPAVAPAVPHSPVRSLLLYLLMLVVGGLAGMIFSFALLSNMVINQAQRIGDQRDEISQLEKLYSRVLESEAKYRNKLAEAEAELHQLTRKAEKQAESLGSSDSPAAAAEKPLGPKKPANCNVESGNGDKFTKCVEEFNRRSGR